MTTTDPRVQRIFLVMGLVSAVGFVVLASGAFFFFTRRDHPLGIVLMAAGGLVAVATYSWAMARIRRTLRDGPLRGPEPDRSETFGPR